MGSALFFLPSIWGRHGNPALMESKDLTFLMHEDRANEIIKGAWSTGARLRGGHFARHHTPGWSAPRSLGPEPMAFALHNVATGGKLAMAALCSLLGVAIQVELDFTTKPRSQGTRYQLSLNPQCSWPESSERLWKGLLERAQLA